MNGCRMREMFSDMPFMYGIVALVVGVALSLASVVVVVVVVVVAAAAVVVVEVVVVVVVVVAVVVVGLWVLRWMKSSL